MKPQLDWEVTDEAEPQTIVKSTSNAPRRWKPLAVLLVVALGVGLGIAYRAVPEPPEPVAPPMPIATPTPSALPLALYQTIDREAHALADGDFRTISALLDTGDVFGSRNQRFQFRAWGQPNDGTLYTILGFGLPGSTEAWADIRQYRDGRYFRETRFYRLKNNQWLRSDPVSVFWSGEQISADTTHFHIIYAVEDRDWMRPIVTQLENDYERMCEMFGCATVAKHCVEAFDQPWCSSYARDISMTVTFRGGDTPSFNFDTTDSTAITLTFASPRVLGLYELPGQAVVDSRFTHGFLPDAIAQYVAYGAVKFPFEPRAGDAIVWAIANWATARIHPAATGGRLTGLFSPRLPDNQNLLPLEELWNGINGTNIRQMFSETYAVVRFIDERFGSPSIPRLLKAIGPSKSMQEAIESSLDLPFDQFKQQWSEWLKQQGLQPDRTSNPGDRGNTINRQ